MTEVLRNRIEQTKSEIDALSRSFPFISQKLSPEEIGEELLHAFLEDRAFNRYSFAELPVKEAFLDAALRMGDLELLYAAFSLVEESLLSSVFTQLLEKSPRLKNAYRYLHREESPFLKFDQRLVKSDNIDHVLSMAQKENGLLRNVIENEMKVLQNKKEFEGLEEVDAKWKNLRQSVQTKNFRSINVQEYISHGGFLKKVLGAKSAIDPFQAAMMTRYWGCDPQISRDFAKEVDNKTDINSLINVGILPRPSK